MSEVVLVLAVVVAVLAAGSLLCKGKNSVMSAVILLAALVAPFVSGQGLHWREVVEGPFAYLDNAMWVLCGAIFIQVLYENGTFTYLLDRIARKQRSSFAQTLLLLVLIAVPGMLTGSGIVGLATTGALVCGALVERGMEKQKAAELAVAGAFFGMALPPLSLPGIIVVISRQGTYPASFEGYFVPLLVMALPALLVYAAMSAKRLMEGVRFGDGAPVGKPVCLLPLLVVAVLVLCHNFLYWALPFLGYPLIYCIGAVLAWILPANGRAKPQAALRAVETAAPAVAVMFACGGLSEILTLTGVNGTIASYMYQSAAPVVYVLVAAVVMLVFGAFLGAPAAAAISMVPGYLIGTHYYTEAFMVLIGVGGILTLAVLLQRKNGLCDRASELAGCESKPGAILKPLLPALCMMLAVSLVFVFTAGSLSFLMI